MSNTYNSITTMIGYVYDADGQRVAKGTITTFSCDVITNGFQTQSDYVRDESKTGVSVPFQALFRVAASCWSRRLQCCAFGIHMLRFCCRRGTS